MTLQELLDYDHIVIQCHDDPDADAVASGWAVYQYLKWKGKQVRLVYGGQNEIQKANMRLMVKRLKIPVEHVQTLSPLPELLLCVDCQYRAGKTQDFLAGVKKNVKVAVIDHHEPKEKGPLPPLWEVRDKGYGSCSTIVWDMLRNTDMDVKGNKGLVTALYYGMLMDTKMLKGHLPSKDEEMKNDLQSNCREDILRKLETNNLSPEELSIVGRAYAGARYDKENRFVLAEVEPCDPNILGIISDQLMEVEGIDVCVVYSLLEGEQEDGNGAKISVRSCTLRTPAPELARELAPYKGGGRSNRVGGGTLKRKQYTPQGEDPSGDGERVSRYLWEKMQAYFARQQKKMSVTAEVTLTGGEKNQLADACITLNGCFTVQGIKIVRNRQWLFVDMPRKMDSDGQYDDICFPVTAEMRQAVSDAVLNEYQRLSGGAAAELPKEELVSPEELDLHVKVFLPKKKDTGNFLAYVSLTLGTCFVVNGIRIMKKGSDIFVSMPARNLEENKYEKICYAEGKLRARLNETILAEYHKTAGK